MSDEESAEEPDKGWAVFAGETLARNFGYHQGPIVSSVTQRQAGLSLLRSIDTLIDRQSERRPAQISPGQRDRLAVTAGEILASIEISGTYSVPTLTGLKTALGFNPVIDILDQRTVRIMNLHAPGSIPDKPSYSSEAAESDPTIEMTDAGTARTGFIAMLAAMLHRLRHRASGPGGPSGQVDFTVFAGLTGYTLDWSPEFAIVWSRFGHETTSPVTDKLDSGNYFFQGRLDRRIKRDPTRHIVSPNRTKTRLAW